MVTSLAIRLLPLDVLNYLAYLFVLISEFLILVGILRNSGDVGIYL